MKNCVPTNKFRHFTKSDEGQALVLTALALVALMLMAGLGVDVGYLRYQKQQLQKAADAGAIAGASAYVYESTWRTAAVADVSANGFTATNGNGITVTVNPAWEGPFAGQAGYIEVSVSQPQPTFFMRVGGFTSVPVRAWSVANANGSSSGCIYALDPADFHSFVAQGGNNFTLSSQCGIRVNSSDGKAYTDGGTACVVATGGIGIVGGYESTQSCSTTPQGNMAPFQDPFAKLAEPKAPGTKKGSCVTHSDGTTECSPGLYDGGISINGGQNVTFDPGLYILQGGGMTINSAATVHGAGVTFYNTFDSAGKGFGPIKINGVSNSSLSAPTSGAFEGILFFEDRTAPAKTNNNINGGSGTTFDGSLYFSASSLNFSGNSSVNGYSIIVADQISVTGASNIYDDYSSLADGPPIKAAVTAE